MKQKTLKLLLALSISSMLFYACSDEEELTGYVKSENNSSEEGRFNNITFKWDYHYSTDSVNHDSNENRVYIGDLMQANADQYTNVNTRSGSVTTDRESYGNPGEDGSGRRTSGDSNGNYRKEEILISNPIPVYLGAVFPENEFGKSFKPEILYPRNPIDVIFNFTRPFIGEITK